MKCADMKLRKPVHVVFKSLALAALCAGVALAFSAPPVAAKTRVSVGIGIGVGVPIHHHGWRNSFYGHYGYYYGYRPYRHYGRYHGYGKRGYGYRGYGNRDRYYNYGLRIYVAPRPVVYPAPVYAAPVYPGPVYATPVAPVQAGPPPSYCREFRTTVNINGMNQPAWGTACLQPDGTWRFIQ